MIINTRPSSSRFMHVYILAITYNFFLSFRTIMMITMVSMITPATLPAIIAIFSSRNISEIIMILIISIDTVLPAKSDSDFMLSGTYNR